MGLVTEDHVWVMPAFDKNWWKGIQSNSCTLEQMRNALPYALFVDTFPWDPNATTVSISGRVWYPWLLENSFCCYPFRIEKVLRTLILVVVIAHHTMMSAICMLHLLMMLCGPLH